MKITVLIENTSDGELIAEHGLSLWIEHEGKKILLDTGSTEAFRENALRLGIMPESADMCVLSHGHYDHSGGLEVIFNKKDFLPVYAQQSAVKKYYSGSGGCIHEIGIPENVLAYLDRFTLVNGYREIGEGIYLVPHNTPGLESIGKRSKLYKEQSGELLPDDFEHEQSLVIATNKGLVIFNSCSHGGVANIIREVQEACGEKPIYAYVGGLHMKGKSNGEEICTFSDEELDALCDVIQEKGLDSIYTGHCTGLPGFEKLQRRLGDMVKPLYTGSIYTL